ncbi:hypothetical protein K469DRAFT_756260 [Zopfia rhizophila CBS 207.26]|uniref:Transcription factor domain-containing protein n=1 Tax=Zopfia rhizophila CBS 207.26 TaxID=1314779 RepID=A0A6A6D8J8_9PEZI|nr:hypothetical protein K469DRAFT_756260 [Zopfia rhizophila CBS 207.26]
MDASYETALAIATDPSTTTQWRDEDPTVPPITTQHRPIFHTFLASLDSPVAHDQSTWRAITSNWLSFLSATSKYPSSALAPNRKIVQWETGPESNARRKKRFQDDARVRFSVQGAVWRLFDSTEALVERWPAQARLLMNRVTDGESATPLVSLMETFGKQRRWNSVWSSLICFLLYCHEERGSLKEMGLDLRSNLQNDLLDIQNALITEGYPEPGEDQDSGLVEQEIGSFILNLLTDTHATSRTNPLMWWMAVLVRSSLQQGSDDYISRGRFNRNILPMDLDARGRLDALLYYAKVFLLDMAFHTWEPVPKTQVLEVQKDLNIVDNSWIGQFSSERPACRPDNRTCDSPAWKSILNHIETTFAKYLGGQEGTAMRQIILYTHDAITLIISISISTEATSEYFSYAPSKRSTPTIANLIFFIPVNPISSNPNTRFFITSILALLAPGHGFGGRAPLPYRLKTLCPNASLSNYPVLFGLF